MNGSFVSNVAIGRCLPCVVDSGQAAAVRFRAALTPHP